MDFAPALVISSNRNLRRHVTRAITSTGLSIYPCNMDRQVILGELKAGRSLCVIDADEDANEVGWLLKELSENHPHLVPLLLSHDNRYQLILNLLEHESLNHLIARQGGMANSTELVDENELIITIHKLMRRDIFGLDKYLPTWGIKIHSVEIANSEDKQSALQQLHNFLEMIDCFGAIKSSVLLVADELIMNAIFNAPRNQEGEPKYRNLDRSAAVTLDTHEKVLFSFACDGRNIALSVKDQFGSLDRPVIVKYLRRCFSNDLAEVEKDEERRAGAGLGLYMVFNSITQLIFNVQAGVGTEVIATFYARGGARAFKLSGRSLNLFLVK